MHIGVLYFEECSSKWQTGGLKEFKCTISSLLSDKFDSARVDLRRLPKNVSLADYKFSMRVFEAFRIRGMAENEDDEAFKDIISTISKCRSYSIFISRIKLKLHFYSAK